MASTTWNPADHESHLILSNGNLTATGTAGWVSGGRSAYSDTTNKYYCEYTWTTITNANDCVGVASATASLANTPVGNAAQRSVIAQNGIIYLPTGGASSVNLGTITNGTVMCMAVDLASSLIWFRKGAAGNWNGNATYSPAAGTGGVAMSLAGVAMFAYVVQGGSTDVLTANFGATGFTGVVPSGFAAGFGSGLPVTGGGAQARVMVMA